MILHYFRYGVAYSTVTSHKLNFLVNRNQPFTAQYSHKPPKYNDSAPLTYWNINTLSKIVSSWLCTDWYWNTICKNNQTECCSIYPNKHQYYSMSCVGKLWVYIWDNMDTLIDKINTFLSNQYKMAIMSMS
jgi:hypothetical protein